MFGSLVKVPLKLPVFLLYVALLPSWQLGGNEILNQENLKKDVAPQVLQ